MKGSGSSLGKTKPHLKKRNWKSPMLFLNTCRSIALHACKILGKANANPPHLGTEVALCDTFYLRIMKHYKFSNPILQTKKLMYSKTAQLKQSWRKQTPQLFLLHCTAQTTGFAFLLFWFGARSKTVKTIFTSLQGRHYFIQVHFWRYIIYFCNYSVILFLSLGSKDLLFC